MPVVTTTELPKFGELTLRVKDFTTIIAEWDPIDNGTLTLEARETGTWSESATADADAGSVTLSELDVDKEWEFRVRISTEHRETDYVSEVLARLWLPIKERDATVTYEVQRDA